MGIYLNPGNERFEDAVSSEIYVDKTELIKYTNRGRVSYLVDKNKDNLRFVR